MPYLKLTVSFALILLFSKCTVSKKNTETNSLKKAYKNSFFIGTAMNKAQIEEKEPNATLLIPKEFSAITPENIMKSAIIHPKWDVYDFDLADKLVAYGKKYNIPVFGHTLIWHSQLPEFVLHINNADSLKLFFESHIKTVASRYDGKVYSWDVVNEALNEDGSMRNSIFLQKLGPEYVVEAFKIAQKAAPNTELYYNDYNIEQPKKRDGAIALIKRIQAAGVRIDGIGIQGHWRADKIPLKEIEASIQAFSKLGIKVMFTELDLTVLPNPWDVNTADVNLKAENNAYFNPYPNNLPDSVQQIFTKGYSDLFSLFLKYKKEVTRVTFWGLNDGQSWLNNWPIKGRTNYPLIFDRNFKPKGAYYKILELPTR
ncbi:MAG: endo-1,4-beta-xylanase [Bacteroidetes bacterium]|nr:endo-1,4-beta-xylanase [Bacteroidota bacterium]